MSAKKNPPVVLVPLSPEFAHHVLKLIADLKADAIVAKDDGSAGPIVNLAGVECLGVLGGAINTGLVEFLRGPKAGRR